MFEKEAKKNKPPYACCSFNTGCELWKDGFQKGAEFVYNKANEELKEKLKPENCLKLLAKEGYIKFTSDQLTKAKEIIEELYNIIPASMADYAKEPMEHARKFLKEEVDE